MEKPPTKKDYLVTSIKKQSFKSTIYRILYYKTRESEQACIFLHKFCLFFLLVLSLSFHLGNLMFFLQISFCHLNFTLGKLHFILLFCPSLSFNSIQPCPFLGQKSIEDWRTINVPSKPLKLHKM